MSLVVFLIAYVIRRRLDRADHLAGDEVWRNWFHRWGRGEAGQERTQSSTAILTTMTWMFLQPCPSEEAAVV